MSRCKVRPIDFTGCDPVIAEHLKRGEAVLCRVWDGNIAKACDAYVNCYDGQRYPYHADGFWFKNADPIETKLYWRKASEIVKWLEDNGWHVDARGDWRGDKGSEVFGACWFHFCGFEADVAQTEHKPVAWFEER